MQKISISIISVTTNILKELIYY